jgi:hypothetical protein
LILSEPPTSRKLAQRLAGRLATLNRFISRAVERGLPFFEVLKNLNPFSWGPTQQKAFNDLKDYLHNLTTLASPHLGEPLLLYVVASPHAVSATLVREREDEHQKKQVLVYYVSKKFTQRWKTLTMAAPL